MEYHITHNKTDKLPVVYPIIFYNGKRNYSYSTNLLDLFANKELAKRILGELSPIHLTELNKISDDELARSTSYCALALTMKHIYDEDARVTWKMVLQAVYYTGNVDMFISAATYLAETRNIEKQDVYNIMNEIGLPKTYQEEVMTLADSLRQEGRQQGIQEGRQEGIQRGRQEGIQQGIQKGRIGLIKELIAAGLPIEQVAIATKATPSEVEQMLLMDV
jgi:predicted transposase/invertase (TIGR01784 family)